MILASTLHHIKEKTKRREKKKKDEAGLKKALQLQDSKQNHSEDSES
jgi:hypothetical protein